MNHLTFEEHALFEHRFWLQILGDHSRFILDSLSPRETQEIAKAAAFVQTFDQLLAIARRTTLTRPEVLTLTQQAFHHADQLRQFKLHLLQRHLVSDIAINLPPTFINHMVNELNEYLRILGFLLAQQIPPLVHPIHHHLLWLLDGVGHADAIASSLDAVEKQLIEQSKKFSKDFQGFYQKAIEMAGYLRTNLRDFPSLNRLNAQVEAEMTYFMDFLEELEMMALNEQVLGTFTALFPDHMFREECYYLTKLAMVTMITKPDCDPTKPRVTE